MSPENANVFIIEDDSDWRERERSRLERAGHIVVGEAVTLADALAAVENFEKLGVQIVTLDGNLKRNDESGQDAQRILGAIREKAPSVKTIGMSGTPINGVDKNLGKSNAFELGEEVTKL
jgi:DNA-binding NtrC family response regulator